MRMMEVMKISPRRPNQLFKGSDTQHPGLVSAARLKRVEVRDLPMRAAPM